MATKYRAWASKSYRNGTGTACPIAEPWYTVNASKGSHAIEGPPIIRRARSSRAGPARNNRRQS